MEPPRVWPQRYLGCALTGQRHCSSGQRENQARQEVIYILCDTAFSMLIPLMFFGHVAKSYNAKQPWPSYFGQERDPRRDESVLEEGRIVIGEI